MIDQAGDDGEVCMSVEVPYARTIKGDIPGKDLGVTLVHEHVIADIRALQCGCRVPGRERLIDKPIHAVDRALLLRDPLVSTDNCIVTDEDTAVLELDYFADAGGGTIVECTTIGLRPDIEALTRVAVRTKANIVAPTGYYLWASCQREVGNRSSEDLAQEMVRDITQGIRGSKARAGVIGEIGTSTNLHEQELRVLKAAVIAHGETGTPVTIHLDQIGFEGEHVIDILCSGGVPADRIVIGHLDQRPGMDPEYVKAIARHGVFLGFDTFGTTFAYDSMDFDDPTDTQRIRLLRQVIDAGYGEQCVLSHDVGMKCMLRSNGGGGYSHLLEDIWPAMMSRGMPEALHETLFIVNPRRWLTGESAEAIRRERAVGAKPGR
jgi:phosphotriesterase-related protein